MNTPFFAWVEGHFFNDGKISSTEIEKMSTWGSLPVRIEIGKSEGKHFDDFSFRDVVLDGLF
jgi:hypothetical protein